MTIPDMRNVGWNANQIKKELRLSKEKFNIAYEQLRSMERIQYTDWSKGYTCNFDVKAPGTDLVLMGLEMKGFIASIKATEW